MDLILLELVHQMPGAHVNAIVNCAALSTPHASKDLRAALERLAARGVLRIDRRSRVTLA